ncbi:ATP-binding protein [Streptomyces ziwulingensis]|uniref:ATP-binding protein n=1 Tax=Streptomyces ziwulingensis TaxID=1045501 RepID=A0ABP9CQL9_9ACTN
MGPHTDGSDRTEQEEYLLRAEYDLDGDDGCVARARRHAAAFLDRARDDHRRDVSARVRELSSLVVSELVTNARKYAPGPVRMELRLGADGMDIIVRDGNPAFPVLWATDADRVGRHGLEIVEAVTAALLVDPEPAGKRVTARLSLR